jgi:hypothetical protein
MTLRRLAGVTRLVSRHCSWVLAAFLFTVLGAYGSTAYSQPGNVGLLRIKRATELARDRRTCRVPGLLSVEHPLVSWASIVVGGDEQSTVRTAGLLIDIRRIDGVSWARRLDTADRGGCFPRTRRSTSPVCGAEASYTVSAMATSGRSSCASTASTSLASSPTFPAPDPPLRSSHSGER